MTDLRAVTLPQPHASLVAAGVQTIVTLPRPTDWRGDLLIHAGAKAPVMGDEIGATGWYWEWDVNDGIVTNGHTLTTHPAPLGAVVAVARVTDCAPIVDEDEGLRSDNDRLWVSIDASRGPRLWSRDLCYMVLGRQLPYADFTPGRWALLLDDVRPVHVPDVKGRSGLWTPDPDLTARVEDAT